VLSLKQSPASLLSLILSLFVKFSGETGQK
jgi:hypothetical protein